MFVLEDITREKIIKIIKEEFFSQLPHLTIFRIQQGMEEFENFLSEYDQKWDAINMNESGKN